MVLPYIKSLINKEEFLSISILLFLGYFYYISGSDLQNWYQIYNRMYGVGLP